MQHIIGGDTKKEWNLFVRFCQLGICGNALFPKEKELQAINWKQVFEFAGYHQVRPLLFRALVSWEYKELVPTWFMEQLKQFQVRNTGKCLNHTKELINIIKLFKEIDIDIIPYKGMILSKEVFGDWAGREMSDIDFLMKLSDFEKVREVLVSRGYQPEFQMPRGFEKKYFKRNCEYNFSLIENGYRRFHIEPHWILGNKTHQTNLDYHDIKQFTVASEFFGERIQLLTPEGLLLTTCVHHGGQDRWKNMKHITDVAAIIHRFGNELNWDELLAVSRKFKVRNIVLLGVGLAKRYFHVEVPPQVLELITKRKLDKYIDQISEGLAFAHEEKERSQSFFSGMEFQFKLREHWFTKLKILFYHIQHILVPNVYDVEGDAQFSQTTYWWLFLRKPFRLLKGQNKR